jgi:hypothetical protein
MFYSRIIAELQQIYDKGYYHFVMICLWHPQSRAFFKECTDRNTDWTLKRLRNTGASRLAVIDTALAIPRMAVMMVAVLIFDIAFFLR